MHRRTRQIPVGEIITGIILFTLTVALVVGISWLGSPAAAQAASPAMFTPAITAAGHIRPVWDGNHPKRWTGREAMCPASSAYMHRWATGWLGHSGPWFRVECVPDGPYGWAWNEITKH